jgi:hypothetical protein
MNLTMAQSSIQHLHEVNPLVGNTSDRLACYDITTVPTPALDIVFRERSTPTTTTSYDLIMLWQLTYWRC